MRQILLYFLNLIIAVAMVSCSGHEDDMDDNGNGGGGGTTPETLAVITGTPTEITKSSVKIPVEVERTFLQGVFANRLQPILLSMGLKQMRKQHPEVSHLQLQILHPVLLIMFGDMQRTIMRLYMERKNNLLQRRKSNRKQGSR